VKSEGICSLDEERQLEELVSEFATDGLRRSGYLGGGISVTLRFCCEDDIGCEDKGRIWSLELDLDRQNSTGGEDMVDVPAVPPLAFIDKSFGFKMVETVLLYDGSVGVKFSRLEMQVSVAN
jgi:hypothetical protein